MLTVGAPTMDAPSFNGCVLNRANCPGMSDEMLPSNDDAWPSPGRDVRPAGRPFGGLAICRGRPLNVTVVALWPPNPGYASTLYPVASRPRSTASRPVTRE